MVENNYSVLSFFFYFYFFFVVCRTRRVPYPRRSLSLPHLFFFHLVLSVYVVSRHFDCTIVIRVAHTWGHAFRLPKQGGQSAPRQTGLPDGRGTENRCDSIVSIMTNMRPTGLSFFPSSRPLSISYLDLGLKEEKREKASSTRERRVLQNGTETIKLSIRG